MARGRGGEEEEGVEAQVVAPDGPSLVEDVGTVEEELDVIEGEEAEGVVEAGVLVVSGAETFMSIVVVVAFSTADVVAVGVVVLMLSMVVVVVVVVLSDVSMASGELFSLLVVAGWE